MAEPAGRRGGGPVPGTPAIALRDVCVSLGGRPVLEEVSLEVEPRAFLAILGPNGGGKSTLLRVILGLLQPDAGSVRILGGSAEQARGRVGYVPQHLHFDRSFPIRVRQVVGMGRLGARHFGRLRGDDRALVEEAMARLEISDLAQRGVGELSGGQLQRVLIARALAQRPAILLLDEPTASLDERLGRSVWDLLDELSHDLAVIVVSHDIGAIARSVRSVACLNRRLHAHPSGRLTPEIVEASYGCPIDLVAHGHPHRVLGAHSGEPS